MVQRLTKVFLPAIDWQVHTHTSKPKIGNVSAPFPAQCDVASYLLRESLANSAHESRIPLNAILICLWIALEGQLDRDTRDNLTKSLSASKSLVYVNDLLHLTTTGDGQKKYCELGTASDPTETDHHALYYITICEPSRNSQLSRPMFGNKKDQTPIVIPCLLLAAFSMVSQGYFLSQSHASLRIWWTSSWKETFRERSGASCTVIFCRLSSFI